MKTGAFWRSFQRILGLAIAEKIESIACQFEGKSDEKNIDDPVYHLFAGLRGLYVALWLEEMGYGEKLALRMNQLIYRDNYGDFCFDDWNRELKKFISDRLYKLESYLRAKTPKKYYRYAKQLDMDYQLNLPIGDPDYSIQDFIEDLILDISMAVDLYTERLANSTNVGALDDIDDSQMYEMAVSEEFESLGWDSHVTSGPGDQGANVVAEKAGIKLIIQCKLYTSPVGNKAVQEVAAAKGYFNGDAAVVVTNSEFTKSARQLASSLGVFLIHHSQIPALDEIIFSDEDT